MWRSRRPYAAATPAKPSGEYYARLEAVTDFLRLVWEASVTGSGGFYLNYVNANGGAGLPETLFANGDTATLQKSLSAPDATTPVILHYVGYGYEKRGCPLWLIRGLESWKRNHRVHRLLVIFHELYAAGSPWQSSFWNSPVQRWITGRLARLADVPLCAM